MTTNKTAIIHEIASAFSLSDEAAQTACLLLEARARTLDFTFDEYMQRYHPEGFAEKDEKLDGQWQGYVQFLGDDASAILRAGKSANFSTLVHECAHVFRRQLTGELREQAEKAFGIEGGTWNVEKEELFAKGLEQWIKRRHGKDKTREAVYNKGKTFVDTVYRGMERIVEIDSRMEEVYEKLFEDSKYIFKQNEYEKALKEVTEGKLPDDSHVFLGMTPRIYEELGFQRLPMAMTGKHLYSTLRASGEIENINYHDLGQDILRQLPEQLKKPLCIIQADNNETDIISIIALKDKENNQIIVPVAHSQKGNFNGAEIDINLVKTVFGKDNFENWLKEAIDDNRLLYIDKKKTEPIWMGQGLRQVYQHFPDRSIRLPDGFPHSHTAGPTTDVFGFLPENIAHYQEAVKKKFPERFTPAGERILYKDDDSQLLLDFNNPPKTSKEWNRPLNARGLPAGRDMKDLERGKDANAQYIINDTDNDNKKFSVSDFIRVEDKYFPHYLKENPEFRSGMIGFYIPSYERKINHAIKEYALSVMDKKPKAVTSCGTTEYHGKIDGRDAIIGPDYSSKNNNRYIRIEFKDERQQENEIAQKSVKRETQRFETGKKLSDSQSRKQSAFENYAAIQEEYITSLANAKHGEKTKIKELYEPLLEKAGKAYGSEAKESLKLYSALRTDLEEGWGRTTVNNPGGKQFIDGEIQKYVNGKQTNAEPQLETARKAGYVQGVCESVAAVGGDKKTAVKLLSEMNVTKDTAKKFANPETYKTLEQGIFAQKTEQKLEQTRSRKL